MTKFLVFGHQNPDTDAITAAISYAYLQDKLGFDVEAVALGEASEETQYALDYFKTRAPRVVTAAQPEVSDVMLVDHNEAQQSISDIKDVQVHYVVDHHRIANFETTNPLFYRAEPVGCTNTIIYKLFQEKEVEIPKDIAGLMLSAIISDTLLFKSPTCTPDDVEIATALAKIADVDLNAYGIEMLKAGTNLSNKTEAELIDLDAKSFPMGKTSVRVAQVNTVDLDEVFARQSELESAMQAANQTEGYDLFILIATDILASDSEILVVGEPKSAVESAFHTTLKNNRATLKGVVSRKKQVVPQLTEVLK